MIPKLPLGIGKHCFPCGHVIEFVNAFVQSEVMNRVALMCKSIGVACVGQHLISSKRGRQPIRILNEFAQSLAHQAQSVFFQKTDCWIIVIRVGSALRDYRYYVWVIHEEAQRLFVPCSYLFASQLEQLLFPATWQIAFLFGAELYCFCVLCHLSLLALSVYLFICQLGSRFSPLHRTTELLPRLLARRVHLLCPAFLLHAIPSDSSGTLSPASGFFQMTGRLGCYPQT